MENLQRIILNILCIHVKDVHIHASFIQTRKQNVGMLVVWVNVSYHVHHHVLHLVMAVVLITIQNPEIHSNQVKGKDVPVDVH